MQNNTYNPDVLSCLANLSNDEVFTPPALANQMLDMLPADLWSNPDAKFLDPCCKSGVFLREIAKRLIVGLEHKIPDIQERLNHIYKNQLFGIAITELTSLLARRSVYCSKNANSKYSICSDFNTDSGNIVFERVQHTWENGRCKYCGASQSEYDRDDTLETHAYQFIHADEVFNMKFDVIIGNPPYQLATGAMAQATPLYDKFVLQAKRLLPKYLTMIIPSRWFSGGMGLDGFRDEMLNDKHIRRLVDFPISSDCFPGVEIKGGVCYFLWDRDNAGICKTKTIMGNEHTESSRYLLEPGCDIFIRFNNAVSILQKVSAFNETKFSTVVSAQKPFGIPTNYRGAKKEFENAVKIYVTKDINFIKRSDIPINRHWINKYKVFMTKGYGAGETFPHQILNKPILGEPNTCCSQTYTVLGTYETLAECSNVISYIKTKFFRFLVMLQKNTQDASRRVYSLVPMQDFSKPWDDAKLYKKYGLTADEIAFIESMVRPME